MTNALVPVKARQDSGGREGIDGVKPGLTPSATRRSVIVGVASLPRVNSLALRQRERRGGGGSERAMRNNKRPVGHVDRGVIFLSLILWYCRLPHVTNGWQYRPRYRRRPARRSGIFYGENTARRFVYDDKERTVSRRDSFVNLQKLPKERGREK